MGNAAEDQEAVTFLGKEFSVARLFAKTNFFFLYGVSSIILPTLSVFGGQLGLNAASVGLVLTVIPFIIFVVRPLIGSIADRLQKITSILSIILLLQILGLVLLTVLPSIKDSGRHDVRLSAKLTISEEFAIGSFQAVSNSSCISSQNATVSCLFTCPCERNSYALPSASNYSCLNSTRIELKFVAPAFNTFHLLDNNSEPIQSSLLGLDNIANTLCHASCPQNLSLCLDKKESYPSAGEDLHYYQFWVFLVLVSLVRISVATAFSLSDTACFVALKDQPQDYGMQRLWGTVGWGVVAPLSGLLIDYVNARLGYTDYTPGYYLAIALLVLQTVVSFKWEVRTSRQTKSITKNVGALLKNPRHLCFLLDIFVIGTCSSIHWYYIYWYLGELKASKLLMGLTLATQSFLGDLPFMFVSGWLIKKLTHINVLRLAFLGFFIKFLAYSYLQNPWWAIAIELLQGPTYGSFYVAMTSYANDISPPGTEATFLSIVLGVFDCLGVAAGSFLGGIGFSFLGSRRTYFVASFLPLVWLGLTVLLHLAITKCLEEKEENKDRGEHALETAQPFIAKNLTPAVGETEAKVVQV